MIELDQSQCSQPVNDIVHCMFMFKCSRLVYDIVHCIYL